MQLTETTLDIIELLGSEPFTGENIRSLARRLERAYPLIHTHINNLREEGLLLEKKTGRAIQCTIDLANPESQYLLGFLSTRSQEKTLYEALAKLNCDKIITAFKQDDKIYVLAKDKAKKAVAKELPFPGVQVIGDTEFTQILLQNQTVPKPFYNHPEFYNRLARVQQLYWGEQQ